MSRSPHWDHRAAGGAGIRWRRSCARFGSRVIATAAFAVGAASIALLALPVPLVVRFALISLSGAASIGTQIVVFGYVATYFPTHNRGTALGVSTGIGRLGAVAGPLLGGYLIAAGVDLAWNFGAFAAVACLGAVCAVAVPRVTSQETTAHPAAAHS